MEKENVINTPLAIQGYNLPGEFFSRYLEDLKSLIDQRIAVDWNRKLRSSFRWAATSQGEMYWSQVNTILNLSNSEDT